MPDMVFKTFDRRFVQMIVMVVGNDDDVDEGDLFQSDRQRMETFRSHEGDRRDTLGEDRVRQDKPPVQTKQQRGVH